jgi:hypothetical protein
VSSRAKACPHCGDSLEATDAQSSVSAGAIVSGGVAFALCMWGLYTALTAYYRDVSVDGVVNIGLVSERQNALILGLAMFLAGIISAVGGAIIRSRRH